MKKTLIAFAFAGATAACGSFEVPNADSPSLNALEDNPTPSVIITATQGLLAGLRTGASGNLSNLSVMAHYGREAYYIDVAQTTLSAFDAQLTPSDGANWSSTYQYVRLVNTIISGLDKVGSAMTDQQKAGIRGFAMTVEAYLLHSQLRAQDTFGIAVDTDREPNAELAPIVSKAAAFTYIAQRLDDARIELLAAGATFAFNPGTGFAGFTTPATFIQVNRALRARAALEQADYSAAQTALGGSFINPGGALDLGPRNVYSTASGDALNILFDPNGFSYVADSMLPREAQLQPGGAVDRRVTDKMVSMGATYRTHTGVRSNYRIIRYASSTAPIPIIKNEELLLIRAEILWRAGDLVGAMADIDSVRVRSGGLAPMGAFPGNAAFENELLYNRRYSLFWEYGHRWVDLRRFGRLQTDIKGPRGAGDLVFQLIPLPATECDQRNERNTTPRCSQVSGFRTTS